MLGGVRPKLERTTRIYGIGSSGEVMCAVPSASDSVRFSAETADATVVRFAADTAASTVLVL